MEKGWYSSKLYWNINKDESLNGIVDKFIENRIVLHAPYTQIWKWDSIKPFIIEGMEKIK